MKKILWMAGWLLLASIAGLGRAYAVNDTARWEWLVEGSKYQSFCFAGNEDGHYRFAVDWGDGTVEQIEDVRQDTSEGYYYGIPYKISHTIVSHKYRSEGTYAVQLYPLDAAATLRHLDVNYKGINVLDVSRNVSLRTLFCYDNKLASLDVSKNTALTTLLCGHNQLTALELSQNINLLWLNCRYNQLAALDLSKNTRLENLNCDGNKLTDLDVSKNAALGSFLCVKNLLTSLDVSQNVDLFWLNCDNNQMISLDMSNNVNLQSFSCTNNQLEELNVSKNGDLLWLYCSKNRLTELDLTACARLWEADFSDNRLSAVTLSENAAITTMKGMHNRLGLSTVYDLLSRRAQKATCNFSQQYDSTIVTVNMPFDLTSEMTISGAPTRYTLLDGETAHPVPVSEYTFEDGIFRFSKPGSHYRLTLINDSVHGYNDGRKAGSVTFAWHIYVSGVANEDLASDEAASAPWAYVVGRTIYLTSDAHGGTELGEVEAFTAVGRRVYRGHDRAFSVPTAGIYVLRAADGRRCKVMVR